MSNETPLRQSVRERALALGYTNEYAYAEAIMTSDDVDVDAMSEDEYTLLTELHEAKIAIDALVQKEKQRTHIRETMKTPLVLRLQVTAYSRERVYGVFANGAEALDWIDAQENKSLSFTLIPLRSPHRTRLTSDDWYGDHCDSDADFVAEVSIPQ